MVYKKYPPHRRDIFNTLKLAIMQGTFKPRERLRERVLAAQFGVSRTPIREAIRKLEASGMGRIVPNQGARVADFSPEEIEALYLVRSHLEQWAGELACKRISGQEIEELIAINRDLIQAVSSGDFYQMIEKDQKLHLTLLKFSRNPFLLKAIEDLRLRSYPISYFFWRRKKHLQTSIAEHKKMIEALRKKDGQQLRVLIGKQLNNSKDSYLEFVSYM